MKKLLIILCAISILLFISCQVEPPITLTITINPEGSGAITTNPTQPTNGYVVDTVVTLTVAPETGKQFVNWTGEDAASVIPIAEQQNKFTIAMSKSMIITANFEDIPTLYRTLTINTTGAGTVSVKVNGIAETGNSPYQVLDGASVELTASGSAPFELLGWSGDAEGIDNPTTFIMNANKTIIATFTDAPPLTLPYIEDFNTLTPLTLPDLWVTQCIVGVPPINWFIEADSGTTGHCLRYGWDADGLKQRVILRRFDMSSATTENAHLVFALKQPPYSNPPMCEEIRVFIKIGEAGIWTQVAEFITPIEEYTVQSISLPDTQGQSSVWIAFEGTNRNAYGAYIDDIHVVTTLIVPNAPTNVNAILGANPGDINISWTEPTTLPENGYNIYKATTSGGPYTKINLTTIPTGTTTFTDNVGDGTYYYMVRSQNLGYLESPNSNETNSVTVMGVGILVGTGVDISHKTPLFTLFNYSYSNVIYLQSEINKSGTIDKISFFYGPLATDLTNRNFTIYMGHTTKSSFTSNTDWITTGLTEVFSTTTYHLIPNQWNEITLTTPFVYNNTDNLFIATDYNQGNWAGASWNDNFYGTAGTGRSISYYGDDENANPINPPTTGDNLYLKDFFPNIKLRFQ